MLVYRKRWTRKLSLVACVVGVFLISQIFREPKGSPFYNVTATDRHAISVLHNTLEDSKNKTILSTKSSASDGFHLAKRTNVQCKDNQHYSYTRTIKVYESPNGDIQLCPIWKIGTTFLKRVFLMNVDKKYSHLINPYDIPYDITYKPTLRLIDNDESSEKIMFVRDPYRRLLSGFVDKLLAPNPVYWTMIGLSAIRTIRPNATARSLQCGHDLEFHEYVKHAVIALSDPWHPLAKKDNHFEPMMTLCKPCDMRYDFIGKMESFSEDSMVFIDRMGLPTTKKLLQVKGGTLAVDDAILDTCHQPFDQEFKKEYLKCITFHEALQRAWKKLQVRGLIGQTELPISESEAVGVTQDAFVRMARRAHFQATSEERKQVQHDYFLKMFDTVSAEDLEMVRKVYADDFKYFEYDDEPSILFDKK